MAEIKEAEQNKKKEKIVLLKTVEAGSGIRLFGTKFSLAISDDTEESFYLKLDDSFKKGDLIGLVCLGNGKVIYRDSTFPVYAHKIDIHVHKNKKS